MRILFLFLIIPSPISYRSCFIKKKSRFQSLKKKGEIESNFLDTTFGGLKLNPYLVQYGFDPMIQIWASQKVWIKSYFQFHLW